VVKLADQRLTDMAKLVSAKKVTPLEFRLHDLPALFQKGGPGAEGYESLTRADVLIHVVRVFERNDLAHPKGSVDPQRDLRDFESELRLGDQAVIERRLDRLDITVRSGKPDERKAGEREQKLLQTLKEHLEAGRRLSDEITDQEDLKALAGFGLLSLKPVLVMLNVGEAQLDGASELEAEWTERLGSTTTGVGVLCAKLEAELAELAADEATEFRKEMGAAEGMVARVLDRASELLGHVTFFTIGEKESRAWTVLRGASAAQAAGRIHSDIERGFIRAEVIGWEELLRLGSHVEAKKAGKLRTEGKDYVVQEGDVINVLFNV